MESWSLLFEVVLLLGACLILGGLFSLLRQSPLVGYLLAGMLLGGPGSLHIVQSEANIEAIAELGVSLLLFSLGLEFSWPQLRNFGPRLLLAGVADMALTGLAAAVAAWGFGFEPRRRPRDRSVGQSQQHLGRPPRAGRSRRPGEYPRSERVGRSVGTGYGGRPTHVVAGDPLGRRERAGGDRAVGADHRCDCGAGRRTLPGVERGRRAIVADDVDRAESRVGDVIGRRRGFGCNVGSSGGRPVAGGGGVSGRRLSRGLALCDADSRRCLADADRVVDAVLRIGGDGGRSGVDRPQRGNGPWFGGAVRGREDPDCGRHFSLARTAAGRLVGDRALFSADR